MADDGSDNLKKEVKAEEVSQEAEKFSPNNSFVQIEIDKNAVSPKDGENIEADAVLGDLLFYLRENKLMSTLMLCRQIEKVEIQEGVCLLCSDSEEVESLISNEKHKQELDSFFKNKGLGFKIKEKIKEKNKVELLHEFFGDKLTVE